LSSATRESQSEWAVSTFFMFASENSHFMSGLFSGESMCCDNTKRQVSSAQPSTTKQIRQTRGADPRSAHVVKSRGEGPGAGHGAPRSRGIGRGGDLEGDQKISFGGGEMVRGRRSGDLPVTEPADGRRRLPMRMRRRGQGGGGPRGGRPAAAWWRGRRGRRRERVAALRSLRGRKGRKRPVSLCIALRHEHDGLDGPDPAFGPI
jgi:hypothetical protein